MRDGDTGRACPVRAEGSSCVVTSGLWPVQRLRHDNIQRKDTYTETGDILLIFEWQLKRGAVLLGSVSSNNKQDQSSPACNTNIQWKKEIFLQFLLLPSFAVLSLLKLVISNSYFMHISKFCLHILWLQKNSVSLISVGTESRFRDSIVRLMSSCYLGWWILPHVLVWISHWLSFQWMSVPPHLSIVLISST